MTCPHCGGCAGVLPHHCPTEPDADLEAGIRALGWKGERECKVVPDAPRCDDPSPETTEPRPSGSHGGHRPNTTSRDRLK